jgi:ParB family transcriptional regulator, chromosome partitioning protein
MNAPLQKGRLGKGLASLIGETTPNNSNLPAEGEQRLVATDQLQASALNPRRSFRSGELQELADSIQAKGLVQPIIVRRDAQKAGHYEIVAGERRWRAAQKAGVHSVPIIVRDLTDKEVLELAIIENVQRADLNAIEEAAGYRELLDRHAYSQDQISEIIGKSRSHVANTLRLLKLPAAVQLMVQEGRLSAGHARALIGQKDAEKLARQIVEQDLNVRAVEALVAKGGGGSTKARKAREKDPDTRAFEKELSDVLGLQVEIKRGSGESGNLTIKYGNFDQLDYIRMRLTGVPGE